MVEIECLACDKTLEIPKSIDTDNYDGQLVCSKCKALLHVKLVKGKLLKYKIVERLRPKGPAINIYVRDEKAKQLVENIGKGKRLLPQEGENGEGEGIQEGKII